MNCVLSTSLWSSLEDLFDNLKTEIRPSKSAQTGSLKIAGITLSTSTYFKEMLAGVDFWYKDEWKTNLFYQVNVFKKIIKDSIRSVLSTTLLQGLTVQEESKSNRLLNPTSANTIGLDSYVYAIVGGSRSRNYFLIKYKPKNYDPFYI